MKLNRRNVSTFVMILVLSVVIGTFTWEIIERLIALAGLPLDLRVGPLGFETGVLSLRMMVNPGTVIAVPAAFRIFRSI